MSHIKNQTVKNWLSRLSPQTGKVYKEIFSDWLDWMKVNGGEFADSTPDMLVEYQKQAVNSNRFDILNFIQRYTLDKKGRIGYKKKIYTTLRSFFLHSRCELPYDRSFRLRAEKPRVVGTLSVEELRDIILSSNPCYQALFLCMFQGGMGIGEALEWNRAGLSKLIVDLKGDPDVVKVDLEGRKKFKNIRPYYSFIGRDAVDALKKWLDKRPEGVDTIFTNTHGKPLNRVAVQYYWLRRLKKLGIIKHNSKEKTGARYGKNLHELRTLFRSLWEKSPSRGSVAEFFMGHQVDPLDYNQAFRDENWTHGEYVKALPYLNIMSSGKAFGQVDESEITRLRRELEEEQERNAILAARHAKFEEDTQELEGTVGALKGQLNRVVKDLQETREFKESIMLRMKNTEDALMLRDAKISDISENWKILVNKLGLTE